MRRFVSGISPSSRAGPTRWGVSAGVLLTRKPYSANSRISTPASNSVRLCLSGSVSEYRVATARKAISMACERSSRTSVSTGPW